MKKTKYLISAKENRKHLKDSFDDAKKGTIEKILTKDLWK